MVEDIERRRVPLSLAIDDYDHVRDLVNGSVRVEHFDLNVVALPVEEIFRRFATTREWDISEFSLAQYVQLRAKSDNSVIAIPIFPSRRFRHGAIYVRKDAITIPADLAGKRVGITQWTQTAGVWARGILSSEYGVDLSSIEWVQGSIGAIDDLLAGGRIHAAITARPPASYAARDPRIVRLVEDYETAEHEYWARTRIYPIMHVVVARSDVVDRWPDLPRDLLRAFELARDRSISRLRDESSSRVPLPWIAEYADRVMATPPAEPWWPYGVEPNRPTLARFLQYAIEQGIAHSHVELDGLFAPT